MSRRIRAAVAVAFAFLLFVSGCANKQETSVSSSGSSSARPLGSEITPSKETTDLKDQAVVPTVFINTAGEAEIPVTKEQVVCTVDLKAGLEEYGRQLGGTVRCRGNGSLSVAENYGKFPYKIKFDNKENPFGLGEYPNKDWVLIPNRGDRTMLRNFAAKRLGEMLSGITCSPKFLAVHLYVNGEYEGVYELTEQIEAAKGRVPVDDGLDGTENGFLIELDRYAREPEEGDVTFGVGKNLYTVKSEVKNEAQLEYIEEYVAKVEEAVYSGDETAFLELADIDSVVDMYLLQEFAKNIDAGFSSFYMYKNKGEKLYFSPPWDFDLAFGNDRRLDDGSPKGLYIAEGREGFSQNHLWYIELCKNDWFIKRVKARWQEISDREIPGLISEVEKKAAELAADMEANFRRWPEFSVQLHQEPDHTLKFTTYKEHTDYLVGWMKDRKEFLDSIYG